jgi:hypothetical protein
MPLCLGVMSLSPAMADTPAQARSAIQALYNKQNAAAAKKDVNGVLVNMAPDFQAVSKDGRKITAAQQRQALTQLFSMAQSIHATSAIQKFRLQGNRATVTVKENGTFLVVNPNAAAAKPARFTVEDVSEDTWVKKGNRWLNERSVTLAEKQLINGQPLRMPEKPGK